MYTQYMYCWMWTYTNVVLKEKEHGFIGVLSTNICATKRRLGHRNLFTKGWIPMYTNTAQSNIISTYLMLNEFVCLNKII